MSNICMCFSYCFRIKSSWEFVVESRQVWKIYNCMFSIVVMLSYNKHFQYCMNTWGTKSVLSVIFCPSNYHMDLCYESRLTGQPERQTAVLPSGNFNFGHCVQSFQPNFFIHAMPIGTIDFCCLIALSPALTLAGDYLVSAKQTSWLHFLTHFSTIRMKFYMVLKQFKFNIMILFLNEI